MATGTWQRCAPQSGVIGAGVRGIWRASAPRAAACAAMNAERTAIFPVIAPCKLPQEVKLLMTFTLLLVMCVGILLHDMTTHSSNCSQVAMMHACMETYM